MSDLPQVLSALRVKIAAGRGKRTMNEQTTKATLIVPVLRALGWDPEEPDSVVHEYKPRRADNPVDYALLVGGAPRLFVEAKALSENLDDRKWASQIMGYAAVAGVEWVALTNGDEYRIFNAHAAVTVDEKIFRTVRVSDDSPLVAETLGLLSRQQWDGRRIEILWQLQFVDRKVKNAVQELFGVEPDNGLVHWIKKRHPNLSPKEIRGSLSRACFTLDFPPVSEPPPKPAPPPKPGQKTDGTKKGPAKREGVTPLDLVKAKIVKAPLALERSYKGQILKATLNAEGRILVGSEAFDSFSAAGSRAMQTVLGSDKSPACPGWDFWHYRDQAGKLLPVSALRREYRQLKAKP